MNCNDCGKKIEDEYYLRNTKDSPRLTNKIGKGKDINLCLECYRNFDGINKNGNLLLEGKK